jgi:hypothetical protein
LLFQQLEPPRREHMATLPTYFRDFLSKIRPTKNQLSDMRTGHHTLRERLNGYEPVKPILVSDFLQGSYRRSTAIRPANDKRSDVDIIVVTNLSEAQYTDPENAMKLFEPFFKEFYDGTYAWQGRSFGIQLSYVDLDVVITSAPSEAQQSALRSASVRVINELVELADWRLVPSWLDLSARKQASADRMLTKAATEPEWKLEPLRIPDRDAGEWQDTHPLEQIRWTHGKNARSNRHYVNVVKAIKWWRRVKQPTPKHPKGYPVEHLIGHCCPDGIESVAEGVTLALEGIRNEFAGEAALKQTPFLGNHGIPHENVLQRISGTDFATFHGHVSKAADLARRALDEDHKKTSAEVWAELFGDRFPEYRGDSGSSSSGGSAAVGGYTSRKGSSDPGRGRFG